MEQTDYQKVTALFDDLGINTYVGEANPTTDRIEVPNGNFGAAFDFDKLGALVGFEIVEY